MTKKCFKCLRKLPLQNFKKHNGRSDGLQADCIECQAAYRREHYKKNKESYLSKAKKRNAIIRKQNSELIRSLKKVCKNCGESHPACLQFHHREPHKKSFIVSQKLTISKERLLEEIAKCDVLCANCHFKEHWQD